MQLTITYRRRDSSIYPCEAITKVNGVEVSSIGNGYDECKKELVEKVKTFMVTDYFKPIPAQEEVEIPVLQTEVTENE